MLCRAFFLILTMLSSVSFTPGFYSRWLLLVYWLAMSNQRSFKIESFRFPAFVPKKIEYIRFWNKILVRNKTFSISTRKFWFKRFCSAPFSNFFEALKKFCFVFKKLWRNLERFGFVLLSYFTNTNVLFWFLGSLEQTKTFRFCSDFKRTKSKRFGFVPIISFHIKTFVLSFWYHTV